MKKALTLLLLAALLLPTLTACGGGETKDTQAADTGATSAVEETTEEVITDGLEDKNMNGFSLNILHDDGTSVGWVISTLDVEEQTGDFINDAIYDRNLYIEERFNCVVNPTNVPKVDALVANLVTSGDATYDIIMQTGSNVLKNMDYITDLNILPYIRLDADYWNPKASSAFRIANKQLSICGNFSLSYICGLTTVDFNKNLWEDLQLKDNPYDLVRSGKWTIDKMFELANKGVADLNGDGVMKVEDDRYGISTTVRGFFNTLSVGAGNYVVVKDKDDLPTFGFTNNEKMVDFTLKILNETVSNPYVLGNSYTTSVHTGGSSDFKTGHALMTFGSVKGIEGLREMEDDFGIVPCPKETEDQEEYICTSSAGETSTLPRSADPSRFENVGMLLEAMSFASQTMLLDAFKEVCLQSRYARDMDSSEMLDICFRAVTFDQGYVLFTNQFYNKVIENTLWTKNAAIASTIASMQSSVEASIADVVTRVQAMP